MEKPSSKEIKRSEHESKKVTSLKKEDSERVLSREGKNRKIYGIHWQRKIR